IYVVRLPAGKDPDELARQNPDGWKKAIAEAQPYLDYMFDEAVMNRDLSKVQDKKAVAKFLLPILSKVAEPVEQSHYLQRLADLVQGEVAALRKSLTAERRPAAKAKPTTPAVPTGQPVTVDRYRAISERFLATLIREPKLIGTVQSNFKPEHLAG